MQNTHIQHSNLPTPNLQPATTTLTYIHIFEYEVYGSTSVHIIHQLHGIVMSGVTIIGTGTIGIIGIGTIGISIITSFASTIFIVFTSPRPNTNTNTSRNSGCRLT